MPQDQKAEPVVERDVAVAMRDGVVLRHHMICPQTPPPWPVLLQRTPYGKAAAANPKYLDAGYCVISQDIRGRYTSDGEWVPFHEPGCLDGLDGYDTIEWIAAQDFCDGNVGTFGASYDAWVQWQAARHRPPHLRAMNAMTIPMEQTEIDYPGAFKLARRVCWWLMSMSPDARRRDGMSPPHTSAEGRDVWMKNEQGMKLAALPIASLVRAMPPSLGRYVESWLKDPTRKVWHFAEAHAQIEVPNLDYTGWFDHCYSAHHLPSMQQRARTDVARTQSKVVIGPWTHGGRGAREAGGFDFGETAEVDMHGEIVRWFDHWLKGEPNGVDADPAVRYFVMATGEWKHAPTWPPPDPRKMALHLSCHGELTEQPGSGQPDAYTNDPVDPVPTIWSAGLTQEPYDRGRLDNRSDILRYRTAPLEADIEIAGHPVVTLFAATTAPDVDFFVHLIDEDPAGSALEVCHGMIRARYRNGLDRPSLIEPGDVLQYEIKLSATAVRFRAGHRIRLEIASSYFPMYARNHQTGGDDLFETDLQPATQTIHHDAQHPSRITLPQ